MTDIHFIGKSGRVKLERASDRDFLWEAPDGIHPLTVDGVFMNKDNPKESLVLLWDNVVSPYGSDSSQAHIESVLKTITVAHQSGKDLGYSSLFIRGLKAILGKYLMPSVILIFVVFILIQEISRGRSPYAP